MENTRIQRNRAERESRRPCTPHSKESKRDYEGNTRRAVVAGDLRIVFAELLPKADEQERTKDGRDQRKIGVGKYLFVDPSKRIRNISGQCVSNRRLEKKIETCQQENRNAAQASSG